MRIIGNAWRMDAAITITTGFAVCVGVFLCVVVHVFMVMCVYVVGVCMLFYIYSNSACMYVD